jgi:hypothetical protein
MSAADCRIAAALARSGPRGLRPGRRARGRQEGNLRRAFQAAQQRCWGGRARRTSPPRSAWGAAPSWSRTCAGGPAVRSGGTRSERGGPRPRRPAPVVALGQLEELLIDDEALLFELLELVCAGGLWEQASGELRGSCGWAGRPPRPGGRAGMNGMNCGPGRRCSAAGGPARRSYA